MPTPVVLLPAGLHLFQLSVSGQATCCALLTSAPVAVPHVLVHIPVNSKCGNAADSSADNMQVDSSEQQQQQQHISQLSGLLFIGSRSSSSQVLGLPAALTTAEQQQQQQQQAMLCPMLQSAFLPSLAGAQAVAVLQDPTGEGQQQGGVSWG